MSPFVIFLFPDSGRGFLPLKSVIFLMISNG
jgi:hypothetical protein